MTSIEILIDKYSIEELKEAYKNITRKENDNTDTIKISELTINMRDDMRVIYGKRYFISNLYSDLAHYFASVYTGTRRTYIAKEFLELIEEK